MASGSYGIDDIPSDSSLGVTAGSRLYDPLEATYRSQRPDVAVSLYESYDKFVYICVLCMYEEMCYSICLLMRSNVCCMYDRILLFFFGN